MFYLKNDAFNYNSLAGAIFESQELRLESEDNGCDNRPLTPRSQTVSRQGPTGVTDIREQHDEEPVLHRSVELAAAHFHNGLGVNFLFSAACRNQRQAWPGRH